MKTFVESLSLGSGAVLIALLSVGLVWLLCFVLPAALRGISFVVVPFILACSLYWLPVWLGNDASEYDPFAGLFILTWFLAGAIPSAVVFLILKKRHGLG
jgi:amino acid permease